MKNVNVAVGKKAEEVVADVDTSAKPALSVVKKDNLFRLVSELDRADFYAAGATEEELDRKQERMLTIDAGNAKLVFGNHAKGKLRDITVEGKIQGSASLASSELDYKILIVFTDSRTYFTLLPGAKLFGFYVPHVSSSAQDAVLNLITNNLARGKEAFEKTSNRLYPHALFLWELLSAVTPEDAVLEMKLANSVRGDTSTVPGKLYFFRGDRAKTALSIGGYRYDFNFHDFPERYEDAFKRVKVNAGKLNHKLNALTFEKSASFKPKQVKRSAKAISIADAGITLTGTLAPGSVPFNPDAPVQEVKEKPAKAKKVVEKAAPAKEGKKKKK